MCPDASSGDWSEKKLNGDTLSLNMLLSSRPIRTREASCAAVLKVLVSFSQGSRVLSCLMQHSRPLLLKLVQLLRPPWHLLKKKRLLPTFLKKIVREWVYYRWVLNHSTLTIPFRPRLAFRRTTRPSSLSLRPYLLRPHAHRLQWRARWVLVWCILLVFG